MFVIDQLVGVSGDEFDRRFIAQQTASLKDALALAQTYARAGDDFDLKDYAERSVPKIEMQLDRILAIGNEHARVATR
jgi:putative membrane protein